jgi:hypothetical protein
MTTDPNLASDLLHFLHLQRDLLILSYEIPGTGIVDDRQARNDLAFISTLIQRLELAARENRL